jgi:HSP20 family protein
MLGRELITWQNPFSLLDPFRRDMDELFHRVFGDWERAGTPWAPMGYVPQVESYTEGNTLHLKADLPGIDPQAVEITVEGTQLTLKGERKAEQEAKDGAYREVRYGSFVRTFPLPEGVKADEI